MTEAVLNKINEQFSSLKINKLNESKSKINIYADYIELICLVTKDYVSKTDVIDRLKDNGEIFNVQNKFDGEFGQVEPEVSDAEESWITGIYEFLKQRQSSFNKFYPFIINENGIIVKTKITNSQELYIYLLISSSLNFFDKIQHILTSEFEFLSEFVLQKYLPNSKVNGFGSNCVYTGNATQKIKNLAKDLNLNIKERAINQIAPQNSKEEGLDLVGWIPVSDNNSNTIIILGQCACGKDWKNKQNETRRYDRFLEHYLLPFIHTLFVPHDFSNQNGLYQIDKDINENTLVFERKRILELLADFKFNEKFVSKTIVERCLMHHEDLV